jgi:hypothetical protein
MHSYRDDNKYQTGERIIYGSKQCSAVQCNAISSETLYLFLLMSRKIGHGTSNEKYAEEMIDSQVF